jgi:hypothetical protein
MSKAVGFDMLNQQPSFIIDLFTFSFHALRGMLPSTLCVE